MKALIPFLFSALPAVALDYKRDVMPIFEAKCFDCHSAEADKIRGGLRLDDEKHFAARFSKNDVVIPGDWDASYLFVTLVLPREKKGSMPPKNKGEALTEKEVMLVAQWIHEGAKIDGERGEKGPDEWDPSKTLKFKDGRIVTEQFGDTPEQEAPEQPAWQTWTNQEGKEIIARFHGLEDNKVAFELKSGTTVSYPLKDLSDESQQQIKILDAAAK